MELVKGAKNLGVLQVADPLLEFGVAFEFEHLIAEQLEEGFEVEFARGVEAEDALDLLDEISFEGDFFAIHRFEILGLVAFPELIEPTADFEVIGGGALAGDIQLDVGCVLEAEACFAEIGATRDEVAVRLAQCAEEDGLGVAEVRFDGTDFDLALP